MLNCGVIEQNHSEVGQIQFLVPVLRTATFCWKLHCNWSIGSKDMSSWRMKKRKQRTFFALIGSILKSTFPTFDLFCLITSQLVIHCLWLIAFEPVAKLRCSAGMGGPHATGRWHQARDLQYTPCYKWISLAHLLPQFAFYVTVFYLFCHCVSWERVVCFLLETSVILSCYYCFLVLSALWFLSLALNVGHLVLFLLFTCPYYHCFVGLFCSPQQVGSPLLIPSLYSTRRYQFMNSNACQICFIQYQI